MSERSDDLRVLAEVLDTPVGDLDYLTPLDDAALTQLHTVLQRSLEAEDRRVQDALQATMRFLPRPLRGRAKKLLFPGGEP